MDIKKDPRKQLDNFSKIFFQIGIVLTLTVIHLLIEYKTYEKDYGELATVEMAQEFSEEIPIVKMIKIKPTQKKAPPPPSIEKIEIVEDKVELPETIIESTETDENEAITDAVVTTDDITEIAEEEVVVEDVPFMMIQNAPVYPGCKGNNAQLKKCFSKKVQEHFSEKFDVNLAKRLGLSEGKKRIYVVFRIDQKGNVGQIQSRGPHPVLEKEVVKIIGRLPQMKPGKQRGIAVPVSYSIPISFQVIL